MELLILKQLRRNCKPFNVVKTVVEEAPYIN